MSKSKPVSFWSLEKLQAMFFKKNISGAKNVVYFCFVRTMWEAAIHVLWHKAQGLNISRWLQSRRSPETHQESTESVDIDSAVQGGGLPMARGNGVLNVFLFAFRLLQGSVEFDWLTTNDRCSQIGEPEKLQLTWLLTAGWVWQWDERCIYLHEEYKNQSSMDR